MADFVATAGFDAVVLIEDTDLIQGRVTGTSVATGSLTNANKQAQKLLNNIEAVRSWGLQTPNNGIASGPLSSGVANYGTSAGKIWTITGAVTPIIFSFADGFNDYGLKKTVVKYTGTATIDFTALPDSHYLFAVWNGTSISIVRIAFDVTYVAYKVRSTAPATTGLDGFYFNTATNKMYREVAAAWVEIKAIFIGGIDNVGAGLVFKNRPYGVPAYDKTAPAGMISVDARSGAGEMECFLPCDATLYNSVYYPELYSLLGTLFGGTGETFATPDFLGTTINGLIVNYYVKTI